MNNKYLTPKEFAAAAGVSSQAVYKQLSGRLFPYVKTVAGHRMIDTAALSELYGVVQPESTDATENQPKTTDGAEENQPKSTEELNDNQPKSTGDSRPETAVEALLRQQLEDNRKEIEFLRKQVEQLTESLRAAQALHAADRQKLLDIDQDQEQPEVITPVDRSQKEETGQGLLAFFRRLFG